jgi:signal transduction histidine kinase
LHGGRLDIQSALAAGTTVTLWFPSWRARRDLFEATAQRAGARGV